MDDQKNHRLAPMQVTRDGLYQVEDQSQLLRVAGMLLSTGAVPRSFRNPEQVAVALQCLKSVGLNPYVSIRQCGMVNGAFTLFGDLPLALARQSGHVESFVEFFFTLTDDGRYMRQCYENANAHLEAFGAVCRVQRKGEPVHEVVFTRTHAQQANLWGKQGPWSQYPARMMQMRARSQALKDIFSDCLAGVAIHEFDNEGVDRIDEGKARAPRARPEHLRLANAEATRKPELPAMQAVTPSDEPKATDKAGEDEAAARDNFRQQFEGWATGTGTGTGTADSDDQGEGEGEGESEGHVGVPLVDHAIP